MISEEIAYNNKTYILGKFYHTCWFMYIAPSSDYSLLNPNLPFKLILRLPMSDLGEEFALKKLMKPNIIFGKHQLSYVKKII